MKRIVFLVLFTGVFANAGLLGEMIKDKLKDKAIDKAKATYHNYKKKKEATPTQHKKREKKETTHNLRNFSIKNSMNDMLGSRIGK